jgi:NADH-quinone oxidoreductase subunit N
MSAPVIWIILPILAGIGLWFTQQKRVLTSAVAIGLCLLLSLAAIFQNIGSALRIGPLSITIQSTMPILGRSFIIENSDRIFLGFIYISLAFWFLGAYFADAPTKFIPLSLVVTALLTAGLAVEPFLYSAILIELAVIISLPLLIIHGQSVGKGVLRFLIFQSLAMSLILLAGWILSGVQTNFSDINQLYIAAFFLGLGFAFWLGIFPFHFWISEFCSENDPFINGFILSILPIAFILIMLNFINGLAWLKDAAFLNPVLRISGVLMVVTGGLWAAMQKDMRRVFGYIVIFESGFALICISLRNELGTQLLYYSLISRVLELALFALSLSIIYKKGIIPDLDHLKGQIREFPAASLTLVIALFSCAGLPLLASFPIKTSLMGQLSTQPGLIFWILLGMTAMLFEAGNLLSTLLKGASNKWSVGETKMQIVLLTVGVFFLILVGIFPSVFLQGIWTKISIILALQ